MNNPLQHILQNNPDIWLAGKRADKNQAPITHNFDDRHSSGYPQLDAILPHHGWPDNGLMEIITPRWGIGELQLLLPAIKSATENNQWVLWISPPHIPYAPALIRAGINTDRIIVVNTNSSCKDALWSMEKALQTDSCAMVLAWSNWLTNPILRRLQISAKKGNTLGILFRERKTENSPASLQLQIKPNFDGLHVKVLKAQGTCRYQSTQLQMEKHVA